MPINPLQTLDIIEVMENFLERERPSENIRPQLDIGYKIEKQSIIISEIRPQWDNPDAFFEFPVAKATYVKAKNHWKVFWRRANGNWDAYAPNPVVATLQDFTTLVEEDEYSCFWG
jgi:hypothetical protein